MPGSAEEYIRQHGIESLNSAALAYLATLDQLSRVAPEVTQAVVQELIDQRRNLKLIASENYSSLTVQLAAGNLLSDKYAEGYPYHRFYAGCENIDAVEALACEEACRLFDCQHAYVQPHSGADANLIAFWAILRTRVQLLELDRFKTANPSDLSRKDWEQLRGLLGRQRLLGMDLYAGGHLTHGYRHNVSAMMFEAYSYGVDGLTGRLDYDRLECQLREVRPLIFLVGYSAYPRRINFARLREMADTVGAVLMVDMAHFAGLVAGGVFQGENNPVPYAHVITSTTHKTLRGPRGGFILCVDEFAESVNKGCPMVIGGPLPHIIAAKAVAFREANSGDFKEYAIRTVANAQNLAAACAELGMTVITGGTDNHLLLIDVRPYGLTGRQAESALRSCRITLNRNTIPDDSNGPWYTSGIRLGTAAISSLGMTTAEMPQIATMIDNVLRHARASVINSGYNKGKSSRAGFVLADSVRKQAWHQVGVLRDAFPLYPELDLDLMRRH